MKNQKRTKIERKIKKIGEKKGKKGKSKIKNNAEK